VHNIITRLQKYKNLPAKAFVLISCTNQNKQSMATTDHKNLIKRAYSAFNSRNIDDALSTFHADVQWPKAFEGGYVNGHEEIRKYWTRQWTAINPIVEPLEIKQRPDGLLAVTVHQVVKDVQGKLLFDGKVKHVYTLKDNLLRKMDIETEQ
jgi:hypothetical protein